MTNGYMVYLLRILAAQGALASVYTDPDDPEGFSAGFVEAVDGQHVLMCDLSPWGQIDGWRVRRKYWLVSLHYWPPLANWLASKFANYSAQINRKPVLRISLLSCFESTALS